MCEVTGKNFEEIYPQIVDDLHSASFISIDCEFSGLLDNNFQYSFFDSPKTRFQNLQSSLDTITIIQFGLSTFKYDRSSNSFTVASYSFYLKPSTVLKKQKFTYELRSLEFLCKHNFNFNKLFYDGCYYLNKSYEKLALSIIEDRSFINYDVKEDLQKYCSIIAEWIGSASEDNEMLLDLTDQNKVFVYMLHGEIRKRFPNIWTFFGDNNVIKIKKIKDFNEKAKISTAEDQIHLKNKFFDCILGFTKIIEELENLKKPIIGHNILIDLILIYKQFYNPSPVSYKSFKKAISKIFPFIYDTKLISFRLKKIVPKNDAWNSNDLPSLYRYLKEGKGSNLVIFTPAVNHKKENFSKENHFHDAGFDSYCAGYCFLKMAHTFSLWDEKKQLFLVTSLPVSSKSLLTAVSSMKNQVNFSRGQVNYIVLDGEDPKSIRPNLLYIQSTTNQPLDVEKITKLIAKFASADIQLLSEKSGLIATQNQFHFSEIKSSFEKQKDYKVTKYNVFKHSKSGRFAMTITIISSLTLFGILVSKNLFKF